MSDLFSDLKEPKTIINKQKIIIVRNQISQIINFNKQKVLIQVDLVNDEIIQDLQSKNNKYDTYTDEENLDDKIATETFDWK